MIDPRLTCILLWLTRACIALLLLWPTPAW